MINSTYPYQLPPLGYDCGALEPYIDALTMEIHHDRHHQAYVNNVNAALEKYPDLQKKTLQELLQSLDQLPDAVRTAVQNNGGGHENHSFFWTLMKKNAHGRPVGKVAEGISKGWHSFEAFQNDFNTAAKTRFGSGWAWLSVDHRSEELVVSSTANQDTPLSDGKTPILGLDVWEHAYYLQYQNKRPDYINAWWHVIDWDRVEEYYRSIVE